MNYKEKIKMKRILSWIYISLGIFMIVIFNLVKTDNAFLSYFGFSLFVVGVAQLRKYARIIKNEETLRKYEIAESDERLIQIAAKARGAAFAIYIIVSCVLSILLHLFEKTALATFLGGTVCFLVLVYWISYILISKKM